MVTTKYKKSPRNTRDNSNRYNFYFAHQQSISNNLELDLLYDKFSDKDFFDDFGQGVSRSSTTYKTRHAKLNYNKNGWDINAKIFRLPNF